MSAAGWRRLSMAQPCCSGCEFWQVIKFLADLEQPKNWAVPDRSLLEKLSAIPICCGPFSFVLSVENKKPKAPNSLLLSLHVSRRIDQNVTPRFCISPYIWFRFSKKRFYCLGFSQYSDLRLNKKNPGQRFTADRDFEFTNTVASQRWNSGVTRSWLHTLPGSWRRPQQVLHR